MTARRLASPLLLAAILGLVLIAGALAWFGTGQRAALLPAPEEGDRPKLLLLTSLPLVFPEEFSLDGGGSPTLEALERRYMVEPIAVADAQSLRQGDLLMLAHPRAQPGEALVDLDRWVRGGGHVLILADPRLDWPSHLPLGHPHRPPPYFADTGLLQHWGLTLEAAEEGIADRTIVGRKVRLGSPGRLSGACPTFANGLVARCTIARGQATIVADADLLQPQGATEEEVASNLEFVLTELARLDRRVESPR